MRSREWEKFGSVLVPAGIGGKMCGAANRCTERILIVEKNKWLLLPNSQVYQQNLAK
jgi:hypothetical protein